MTRQPDIGSVQISYRGPRIDRAGLLRYVVSFREHEDFHEACIERMYTDILERCAPEKLTVHARRVERCSPQVPARSRQLPGTSPPTWLGGGKQALPLVSPLVSSATGDRAATEQPEGRVSNFCEPSGKIVRPGSGEM